LRSVSPIRLAAAVALVVGVVGLFGSASAAAGHLGAPAYNTRPVRLGGSLPGLPGGPSVIQGTNVNITNKSGAQSETSVAVDPTNGLHLLAASNDLTATSIFYESTDGGRTWTNAGLNLGSAFCYDTWLDFNAAGDAFASYECGDERIAYRKAGTSTWVKTTLTNAGGFPDRDMVTVDTTSGSPFDGSVYIGYDDNGSGNKPYILYSRDGFGSWTRSPKINDTSAPTIGVNAAVGSDGTLYATWEDYSNRKIMVDRSTDGGATWSTDHVVTTYRLNTPNFFLFIPPQPDRGIVPFPVTDAAPAGTTHAGRLYVAYTDKSPTGSNTNIYVRYSDDGGTTWSAETKVNDDTVNAYHFHPAISVSPNGTVGVSFYDTRADSTNKKTQQFATFSRDGGVTWSANKLVSSAQSDESGPGDPNDYGDYQGLDAGPRGSFAQVWTDSRPTALAEDLFYARVKP